MTKVLYNGFTIDLPDKLDNNEKETDLFIEDENLEETKEFKIEDTPEISTNIEEIENTLEFKEEGDVTNEY